MKFRRPELILVFYMLSPLKSPALAQIVLGQVKSIHVNRQAEKQLNLDLDRDTDQAFNDFLTSFWLSHDNIAAYAYLGLLAPNLGWFNFPMTEIRRKIARNKLRYSQAAVNQSIRDRISTDEIEAAIVNGQLVEEYTQDRYGSNYLVCGLTQADRPIHIECTSLSQSMLEIIAVYIPDPEQWDENFMIRRGNDRG